jgi:hypothetical protein
VVALWACESPNVLQSKSAAPPRASAVRFREEDVFAILRYHAPGGLNVSSALSHNDPADAH